MKPQIIKGQRSSGETVALGCDFFLLLMFVWIHVRYGEDMLFLVIPLFLIGLYFLFIAVFPEQYVFGDTNLSIGRGHISIRKIDYSTVFNYEASERDRLSLAGARIKIYHTVKGKKTLTVCRPKDMNGFINLLNIRCPVFQQKDPKTTLDVFWR